jgi:hypothetical protein
MKFKICQGAGGGYIDHQAVKEREHATSTLVLSPHREYIEHRLLVGLVGRRGGAAVARLMKQPCSDSSWAAG